MPVVAWTAEAQALREPTRSEAGRNVLGDMQCMDVAGCGLKESRDGMRHGTIGNLHDCISVMRACSSGNGRPRARCTSARTSTCKSNFPLLIF